MSSVTTSNDERSGGGFGSVLRVRVELWLVVVFMALAFGAGVIVTALYEEPAAEPIVGFQNPAGQVPAAPPLTDEQIQQGLPSGHPDLSGGATGATGPGADAGFGESDQGGDGKSDSGGSG